MGNWIRTAVAALSVAGVLASSSGCAAGPTSTYTNAVGQEVTVNWRDYPLHAYTMPDEVLAAPVQEDAEEISAAILSELKTALGREYDLEWNARGEQGWYPSSGNGYGGDAMTTTWNSVGWNSNTVPTSTAEWRKIMSMSTGTPRGKPPKSTNSPAFHHGPSPSVTALPPCRTRIEPPWSRPLSPLPA
ncbi:hypothetical protein [Arthrobacter sp.]|uniref:hypothetical protein n=1 Tax=Arthrobacter sp. TaxID=1667 RepID=UPI0026E0CD34|nr:hypothetical protein [Arthrobacter sp.]MDO5752540.1 hypothetical protein [Arthrobacter sp.]